MTQDVAQISLVTNWTDEKIADVSANMVVSPVPMANYPRQLTTLVMDTHKEHVDKKNNSKEYKNPNFSLGFLIVILILKNNCHSESDYFSRM